MPLGLHSKEKHLYHATKAPVVVYTAADEQKALAEGYGYEYIPQEYPKHVNGKLANNAEEEAAILAAGEVTE